MIGNNLSKYPPPRRTRTMITLQQLLQLKVIFIICGSVGDMGDVVNVGANEGHLGLQWSAMSFLNLVNGATQYHDRGQAPICSTAPTFIIVEYCRLSRICPTPQWQQKKNQWQRCQQILLVARIETSWNSCSRPNAYWLSLELPPVLY